MTPRFLSMLAIGIAAATFSTIAQAGDFPKGSPKFLTDYNAAQKEAKKADKPMVVVFSASWCPPCQANKRDVYPSKDVTKFHEKFIWAYLDTDEQKNAQLAKKFQVRGIPHVQLLSKSGKNLGQVIGGTKPGKFAESLESALKKAGKKSQK